MVLERLLETQLDLSNYVKYFINISESTLIKSDLPLISSNEKKLVVNSRAGKSLKNVSFANYFKIHKYYSVNLSKLIHFFTCLTKQRNRVSKSPLLKGHGHAFINIYFSVLIIYDALDMYF